MAATGLTYCRRDTNALLLYNHRRGDASADMRTSCDRAWEPFSCWTFRLHINYRVTCRFRCVCVFVYILEYYNATRDAYVFGDMEKREVYSWSRKAATRGGEKWGSRGEETMSGEYTQRRKRRCTDTTTPLVYYILYIPMRMRCWGQQVTVAPYDECRPRFQSLVRSFYPSVYMHVHKHTHTHAHYTTTSRPWHMAAVWVISLCLLLLLLLLLCCVALRFCFCFPFVVTAVWILCTYTSITALAAATK